MKLYHGSNQLVVNPQYNVGNPTNDYGKGFYLTDEKEMARLWASKNSQGGFCMEYEVNTKLIQTCHLEDGTEESILKWITMLVTNRFSYNEYQGYKDTIEWMKNHIDIGDVMDNDMIIGYRADDSYFAYSRDFVANNLSIEALSKAMHLGNLGKQYVLKSEKAFSKDIIRMTGYEEVSPADDYQKFISFNNIRYQKIKKEDDANNTFIRDIMRRK